MKFKELYLNNEVEFEAIDDYTQEWGFGDSEDTLCSYLGLNDQEEDLWISEGDESLQELLNSQKNTKQ